MKSIQSRRLISTVLSLMLVFAGMATASAGMVATHDIVAASATNVDRAAILASLDSAEVIAELEAGGVDHALAKERVAALSVQELAQLHAQFDDQVAGQGAIGILVTLFIVFVVTDMLCATNIFKFVNCINR